ncbi:class I SAM-dependent methyltransferase [Halosimplex rubrum]|uniref:Class I SAM-dependent methyltransferase n=1 Tax=Halosimplex rubrum TaxID=869889 RepID=A0A7D5T3Y8_9EURY|nr:class I SAM-dependent methyltransferase [Halosimplex rubrum]QLH77290.1 class I SAM-dependent methyltransferase [Halosimplex rubrum]
MDSDDTAGFLPLSLAPGSAVDRGDLLRRSLRASGALELVHEGVDRYNRIAGSEGYEPPTDLPELRAVQRRARRNTDTSDHLERLFVEALAADPDTVVELGVRGGESTFVFERVARLTGADLVSVDVEGTTYDTDYERWEFVRSDDVAFAEAFEEWCAGREVDPAVDVLFVDTSHEFEHTVAEIDAWFPHLADDAVVLFHDTNMRRVYRREDGTVGLSRRADRGVIRALEEHFECSLDETESFATVRDGFVLEQRPSCSGLAVLKRLGFDPAADGGER